MVGLSRKEAEPNQPNSVYLLVTDAERGEDYDVKFVDTDIEEAIEAFQQGWIELESEIPPKRNRTP